MRLIAFLLLVPQVMVGQTSPSPALRAVIHRRVPETYCELLERGTLQLADSGIVLRLDDSGETLHPIAFSYSRGFVEYDPNELSSDDREDVFDAARDAGYPLRVGPPSSVQILPTLRQAKSMPDVTCTDLKAAHDTLAAQPVPEQIYNAGSQDVTPPETVTSPQPKYPQSARRKGIQGDVVVAFIVKEDGTPTYIFVSQSLDPDLDQSAIEAVHQWRFHPAVKDGHAVATAVSVHVHFGMY